MSPLYLTTVVALLVTSTVLVSGAPVWENRDIEAENILERLTTLLEQARVAEIDKETHINAFTQDSFNTNEQENKQAILDLSKMILEKLMDQEVEKESVVDVQEEEKAEEQAPILEKLVDQEVEKESVVDVQEEEQAKEQVEKLMDQEAEKESVVDVQEEEQAKEQVEKLVDQEVEKESVVDVQEEEQAEKQAPAHQEVQQQTDDEEGTDNKETNSIESISNKLLEMEGEEKVIAQALEEKMSHLQEILTSLKSLVADVQGVAGGRPSRK